MWNDALPRNGITNWSVFYDQKTTSTANGWLSWMKPAGCSWVYVWVVGAGGAGASTANGAIIVGGGGGGSGAITRLLIPATFVPDILYVRPGVGGGASAGANGQGGIVSYISIAPNTTAQNLILAFGGGGGGQTTGAVGGAGAVATSASGIWMNIGLFTSIAGQSGATGAASANTNGSDVTFGASGVPVTGGAGGGNGTGNGGGITGAGLLPSTLGGAGTTGSVGSNGFRQGQTFAPGFKLVPLLFSGGSGGGGNLVGTAGNGGNGSWGCGGGGAGGCFGAGTGGLGGNGGGALILIGAF